MAELTPPPSHRRPISTIDLTMADLTPPSSQQDLSSPVNGPLETEKPSKLKSLADLAEEQVLKQLKAAVDVYEESANYCCGGRIPVSASTKVVTSEDSGDGFPKVAPPITMRWDSKSGTSSNNILFPVPEYSTSFEELLKTFDPAEFEPNEEHVFEETYRKARKLDRKWFSVDFHPHDYGILDAIGQLLLPDLSHQFLKERKEHRGVVSELYELNIHSGPGEKFKTHVGIPRSTKLFGTLVVCLPHAHIGGELRVKRNGYTTYFDWNGEPKDIQWAAFCNDCEYEVLQVTDGHLVTLTYNLYISQQVGSVLQDNPTADFRLSPLYEAVQTVLGQPGFMKKGGILGFYCVHMYSHDRKGTRQRMPYALKGIDMTLFSVFTSLGLNVTLGPALDLIHMVRDDDDDAYKGNDDEANITIVGNKFRQTEYAYGPDEELGESIFEMLDGWWPCIEASDVEWLNECPDDGRVAAIQKSYYRDIDGEDRHSVRRTYHSNVVILAVIPAWKKRKSVVD